MDGNNITSVRLRELRAEKAVSQDAVAESCGISRVALARYENGSRMPKAEILSVLADYYGTTSDYLLGREEEANDADNQSALDQLGPNQRYIAENLPKLNEEQAKIFRALLEQMGIK